MHFKATRYTTSYRRWCNSVNGLPSSDKLPAALCGQKNHSRDDCHFRDANCYSCGKRGHIAPACKSTPEQKSSLKECPSRKSWKTAKMYRLDGERSHSSKDSSSDEYELHGIGKCSTEPVEVQMMINGKRLDMDVNTGTALSLSYQNQKESHFP